MQFTPWAHPTRSKVITILLALLTVIDVVNGATMFAAPSEWFRLVIKLPASQYGGFSYHFIRDISFVYLASALGQAIYIFCPSASTIQYLVAISAWHVVHAVLHASEAFLTFIQPESWKPTDWPADFGVYIMTLWILGVTIYEWKRLKKVNVRIESGERKRMNSLDGSRPTD